MELTVENSGHTVDPARVDTLFEPFERGASAPRKDRAGSGLGLSIARSIVESHDGTITATARTGGGLSVSVTLPASVQGARLARTEQPEPEGASIMPAVSPDPTVVHPMPDQPRVVLLRPLVTSPLIEVGEFTYYDDPGDATAFETRNVLYHYGPERLVIGRFCALAEGARFIMNGANHRMDGPSAFPFPIMGGPWGEHFDLITGLPGRGDTVVGHDVWLGYQALVMPGVHIGNGAIVASGSVVVVDVPDYAIVGGNPAKLIRRRYSDGDVDRLLALAWWDWPLAHITEHVRTIMSGSIEDLEAAAASLP